MTSSGSILVTGAGGFLGSALGRRLTEAGERVIGFDRDPSTLADAPFPCVAGDVQDLQALDELCRTHAVDRIVHAGGVSGRAVARDDRTGTLEVNVVGTANVFEAARRHGVRRVVLCSSGSVYGRSERALVIGEAPLVPVNAYGASKVASEAIMHSYAEEADVDGVALRIFQAYGPGRRTRCNLRTIVEAALQGRVAVVPERGDARMQYVHVVDVVDASIEALRAGTLRQRVYNIAGGTSLTLQEVAAVAADALPGLEVRFGDDPLSREYCLRDIDLAAAERDLGYVPRVGLAVGIAAYAADLRRRLARGTDRTGVTQVSENHGQ